MQTRQKKPPQPKICQCCGKPFPALWRTFTIDGVRKKCCKVCSDKALRLKEKEKKEKVKVKKRIKRERITEKKLDTIFSRLVRNIYPYMCHSTLVPVEPSGSHCAHLVSRRVRCVRFDVRNCYPTLPEENMYNSLHVIQLAKRLKEYYGIEIDEWEAVTKQSSCKLTEYERREMYEVFKSGLDTTMDLRSRYSGEELNKRLTQLRLEIIKKKKKVM